MGGLVRGGDGLVLNKYRHLADPYLTPMAKRMSSVHPDILSWIAFAFAILAGVSFWAAGRYGYHLLLLAFLAILLNALFDALDGWVARLTNVASKRGDFLDHVLDRYADAFIIGGIVLSAYSHFTVGLLALLGVIFTSYMGTQSQALGLDRNYGGLMGRADRLVYLLLATLVQWAFVLVYDRAHLFTLDVGGGYPVTVLELLLIWIALAGHITAVQRGVVSWRALSEQMVHEGNGKEGPKGGPGPDGVTVEVAEEVPRNEGEGDPDKATEGDADDGPEGDADDGPGGVEDTPKTPPD
jgi:archaetidylinositol phosphate synthase